MTARTEEARKNKLLGHYARKPIQRFLQLDATHAGHEGDPVAIPDRDGDVVFFAVRDELQAAGYEVRLRIPEGADLRNVPRMLRKIAAYIESGTWGGHLEFEFEDDDTEGWVLGVRDVLDEFAVLTGNGNEDRFPGWYQERQ